jgi:hypothetical protein
MSVFVGKGTRLIVQDTGAKAMMKEASDLAVAAAKG